MSYHNHTRYSDGKDHPEHLVQEAVQTGLPALGISDHAPLPFHTSWAMKMEKLSQYREEIVHLKTHHADKIQLYCGLEIDYIPNAISTKHAPFADLGLDYTIGSIHYVDQFEDHTPWPIDSTTDVFSLGLKKIFRGDIRMMIHRYYELTREMVSEACPTIIGHLDRIKLNNPANLYYDETEPWYREEVVKTLECIAGSEAILEVNTKIPWEGAAGEPYPSRWILEIAGEMGISVHLASDAHQSGDICRNFEKATALLLDSGFKQIKVLINNRWQYLPLSKRGIEWGAIPSMEAANN